MLTLVLVGVGRDLRERVGRLAGASEDIRIAAECTSMAEAWLQAAELGADAILLVAGELAAESMPDLGRLTAREREVLLLLAEGGASKEIGARLGITARTVDTHRHRIARKLGARGTADLVKLAIRAGLTPC